MKLRIIVCISLALAIAIAIGNDLCFCRGAKSGMNTIYTLPNQALAEMYLIQAPEPAPLFNTQFEQAGVMHNEGSPEYFIDQGFYYPTTAGYGCISSGFESAGDPENHQNVFCLDGQGIHYAGLANENLPYLYYTPTYEYTQSSYNPYNPYIPGAMVGVDGYIAEPQQYCTFPSYENSVALPGYMPAIIQSRADTIANETAGLFLDNAVHASKVDVRVPKHNFSSNTPNSSLTAVGDVRKGRNSFARVPEVGGAFNTGGKELRPLGLSGSHTGLASPDVPWTIGPRGTANGLHVKGSCDSNQLKSGFTSANGLSGSNSTTHAHATIPVVNSKSLYGRTPNITRVAPQTLSELNRASGTNKLKNELVLKAYTMRAGNPDAQGNITIRVDQYSNIDRPLDFVNAKFFVIKSYSEDDVHKSIKYNVWSSTPNGNKRLNAAYEDAQGIAAGGSRVCPVFLFFSVNASGQFCGVAEMTGPVDFLGDMDFWQQDKWSGSFPVKWHIIKDVPNPNFRHIILENNEYRPVTNSRDTQEICWKKGLEMLQIFNNYTSKTSLLDDFMYYENRQRILLEERARSHMKDNENPSLVSVLYPRREIQSFHDFPTVVDVNCSKSTAQKFNTVCKTKYSDTESNSFVEDNSTDDNAKGSCEDSSHGASNPVDDLEISSLTLHSDVQESEFPLPSATVSDTTTGSIDVVTIGSMPVRIAGSSGVLTVGTIPLDLHLN